MNNIKLFCFGLILLVFSVGESHAVALGFNPSSKTVSPSETFSVDVNVSGLGNFSSPSLGAFDLDITFDPAILAFNSVVFGSFLGDPALFEAVTSASTPAPGIVNINEVSFLEDNPVTCVFCFPPFLESIQPAAFTLATLDFTALSAGVSALGIVVNAIGDGAGLPLSTTIDAGIVRSVPEPATIALLGAAFAGLGFSRRRKSAS